MRKFVAILIALFLINTATPIPTFAKKKDKKGHLTHRQRKERRKQRKHYEKVRSRANNYREPAHNHVGEHMFKKQTHKVQKWRSKNHLKP